MSSSNIKLGVERHRLAVPIEDFNFKLQRECKSPAGWGLY